MFISKSCIYILLIEMSDTKTFVPIFPDLDGLCNALVTLLKRTGMTQQEISNQLAVSQSEISRLLNWKSRPEKGFAKRYNLLRSIMLILLKDISARYDMSERSEDIYGFIVEDGRIRPMTSETEPFEHRQLPTKSKR
jgi:transcriptional regulator with XRE-family HTH domain